ncbi:hypothetical protein Tsubulata_042875 [Turnera subulata]|uniref:Bifunctional inhibitor/plant lipid transfer protein/seed storage helical domain-containing protein n=1 Tax=Turnera subulata TaxID=218843 RepID=A0A9Q0F991_9ROSI|nr:hypothetical protein Tsubulata_042875 [Turnera subulata]
MKGAVMSVLVVLAMVQFMAKPGEAITCGEVNSYLVACLPYLSGQVAAPPAPCCAGVSKLKDNAARGGFRGEQGGALARPKILFLLFMVIIFQSLPSSLVVS